MEHGRSQAITDVWPWLSLCSRLELVALSTMRIVSSVMFAVAMEPVV